LQSLSSKEISRKHFPTQEITLHNFLNNTASLYRFAQFLSNLAAVSKLPLHLGVIISYAQIYLRVQSALHFIIDFEDYIVKINDKNLNHRYFNII